MYYVQKFIIFLCFMSYTIFSYAADSTSVELLVVNAMHRVSKVDVGAVKYQPVQYAANGDQIVPTCPADHSLVHIQNASKQVFWGPPAAICNNWGSCSGFGCYCAGSPHSCCGWCSPPCKGYTQVKWQTRPTNNQSGAISENMPSVLSQAGCAPVKTVWETVV